MTCSKTHDAKSQVLDANRSSGNDLNASDSFLLKHYPAPLTNNKLTPLKVSSASTANLIDFDFSLSTSSAVSLPIYREFMDKNRLERSLSQKNKVELPQALPPPASLSYAKPVPEHINPRDPLSVGIYYHEQSLLHLSAYYFSISAARGDPTGLFLFAISLRHGWGVKQNQVEAFKLLSSVTDAIASEDSVRALGAYVPLALYEVGMSFLQGWGVKKSQERAAYYFKLAAQLGDSDGQIALAECFLRGDGVKPSKKLAATWFRKAEGQGARLVQMQWIWKEKYND